MDNFFYTAIFLLFITPIAAYLIEDSVETTSYPSVKLGAILTAFICAALAAGLL
jgi:hypothetical protein